MKVSVIGATAYTSLELLKILARHPEAEVVHLGGRREEYPRISDIFTSLRGVCDLRVLGMHPDDAPEKPDVAFFCLPHGLGHRHVPDFLNAGIRCIDFSADYRLADLEVYERWYGEHEDPDNIERAAYGIPELWREDVSGATLVANPGCYPTAAALALAPLVRDGPARADDIVVDAKSGVSGRGNKPNKGSMYCECNEDTRPYRVAAHRHEPEIEQCVSRLAGQDAEVTFVPHLVPMDRGILATVYVKLNRAPGEDELQTLYARFYEREPFVRVCRPGDQPRTKDVAQTNFCDVAVVPRDGERAVATAAIDNLVKGAAGQAVQNMNLMFGLQETSGLR